jgi:hypothetical protein
LQHDQLGSAKNSVPYDNVRRQCEEHDTVK